MLFLVGAIVLLVVLVVVGVRGTLVTKLTALPAALLGGMLGFLFGEGVFGILFALIGATLGLTVGAGVLLLRQRRAMASGGDLQLWTSPTGGISLESLFKRQFWVVALVLIAVNMFVVALVAGAVIDYFLAPLTVVVPKTQAVAEEDPLADQRDDNALAISQLLTAPRDQAAEPEPPDPEPEEDEPEPEPVVEADPSDCVQSSLSAKLVGTMTDDRGDYSFALVQDQTRSRTVLARIGDEVAGATVSRVENGRMWVNRDGAEECLRAGQDPGTAPAPTASRTPRRSTERESRTSSDSRTASERTAARPTPAPAAARTTDLAASINRVSSTQYDIQRSAIDEAMANPQALQTSAPEFRQAFDNGNPSGIQITTMPRGSLFSRLGIRRGDIIMQVNGQRITTPQRAIDLYEAMQNESNVELVVQRRGRQRTLTYNIE